MPGRRGLFNAIRDRLSPVPRALAVLALICFLGAAPCLAASVLIVRPANSPPVMVETLVRLQGELTSAGFATEIVESTATEGPDGHESRIGLERLAERRHVDAVLAVVGDLSPDSVEVWVIDKVTGKSVVRRVPFAPMAERAPKTLAIQAIELLRASFLEIDLAMREQENQPRAEPPPAVVHFVEMEQLAMHPERFSIEAGGVAVMSLDGVGPAVLPLLRFSWALRPWFLVQAAIAGLGTRPTVETLTGNAQIAQTYGLLGGCFRFRAGGRWQPIAVLSAGVLHTSVDGQAAEWPDQGRSVGQWSLLLDAGVGVVLRLRNRFHLSLAAHAQMAQPYLAVRFLDAAVATSERPNLLLTLTIGTWL